MALKKHNIICSIFLATLIAWQFIYYVSGSTKRSWGLKHKDTVKSIVGDNDLIDFANTNKQLASNHPPIDYNNKDLKYALVRSDEGHYYGATATLTLWKPKVDYNEFSLTQLWLSSGYGTNINTIEVGWTVFPSKYGDDMPRFFVYWTRDYYTNTGCYNSDCPGFVQVDFSIKLGDPISTISTVGGPIFGIRIMVYKDARSGNWWLSYNGVNIGYFPENIFTSLSEYAQRVDFGGEILNRENNGHHTTTQMGSGLYPHQSGASYITGIRLFGLDRNPVEGNILQPVASTLPCYRIVVRNDTIFYGGPGYSALCR
ncbi:uncharacterized protein LOC124943696 [Impatiens glandulifera]|uniref:uncharacterized protein LOC124943696 n=1 Tax=Impatiens glandulifera TaxID=253017 RepID=UPI001FB195FD|nr:uncharacterized protein LOC124943696 [Impatiens glandulifera]